MPELPEVETIKRGLQKKIIGSIIKDVVVLNSKTFEGDKEMIIGMKVTNTWRKAKVLGIDLKDTQKDIEVTLLFHLKMTGQVIFDDGKRRLSGGHPTEDMRDEMPNKSTRVIFEFSDETHLYFNDQRKFGWIKVVDKNTLDENTFLKGLGPEPLEKDFNVDILKKQLQKRKSLPVKAALMDQQLISGIGNIYASEACFNASIDPRRKVSTISDQEFINLHKGILKSLEDGIKHGGSSRAHYVNSDGKKGVFLDYAYVYQRNKDQCKICGAQIQKTTLSGRSTFFCPHCQT